MPRIKSGNYVKIGMSMERIAYMDWVAYESESVWIRYCVDWIAY